MFHMKIVLECQAVPFPLRKCLLILGSCCLRPLFSPDPFFFSSPTITPKKRSIPKMPYCFDTGVPLFSSHFPSSLPLLLARIVALERMERSFLYGERELPPHKFVVLFTAVPPLPGTLYHFFSFRRKRDPPRQPEPFSSLLFRWPPSFVDQFSGGKSSPLYPLPPNDRSEFIRQLVVLVLRTRLLFLRLLNSFFLPLPHPVFSPFPRAFRRSSLPC